jgi:hypothetical protein
MPQQVRDGAATVCEGCGTEYPTPSAAAYCCLESD